MAKVSWVKLFKGLECQLSRLLNIQRASGWALEKEFKIIFMLHKS